MDVTEIVDRQSFRSRLTAVNAEASALSVQNILGILYQVDDQGNATPLLGGGSGGITGLSGDVAASGIGVVTATIQPGVVTYAKIQNVVSDAVLLGNIAGAGSSVSELTAGQVRTLLALVPIATSGSASDLGAGTLPAGRFPALTGDVTTTAGALATTIATNAVTFAKFQQIATGSLLGRSTSGTGNVEVITIGSGLSLSAGTLTATGGGGTITALTGDVAASGSGSVAATLATVNSDVGSFTNANITVNAKGLITAASNGSGGASYTFGTGLTNTSGIITANLATGAAGGQTAYGGTLTTQSLTLRPNAADSTTGYVITSGNGVVLPTGAVGAPALTFTGDTTTGMYFQFGGIRFARSGVVNAVIDSGGFGSLSSTTGVGFSLGTSGAFGLFYDAPNGLKLTTANPGVDRVKISNSGNIQTVNTPFISFTSGSSVIAQANGTVMEYGITPPTIASSASAVLDAYKWNATTVTLTGTTHVTTATGFNFLDIEPPTYTAASAVTVDQGATFTLKGPPIAAGSLTLANAYVQWNQKGKTQLGTAGLFGSGGTLQVSAEDAYIQIGAIRAGLYVSTSYPQYANVCTDQGYFGNSLVGYYAQDFADLYVSAGGANTLHLGYGADGGTPPAMTDVATVDASGFTISAGTAFSCDSISAPAGATTNALTFAANGNVRLGQNATLAASATNGFPQMPDINGKLTGTPVLPFTGGAPFGYDHGNNNLSIYNTAGTAWDVLPAFNNTATAGSQVGILTNLPAAVVSTTPQYWLFRDKNGVATYIQFYQ